jgi:drug/metabolite transporter (DMT)-like permease
MTRASALAWTALAMLAFAANSLLCRIALHHTGIDPASFTALRLAAGALVLWLLLRARHRPSRDAGSWTSAFALFVYAAAFSFAYVDLSAATGALLLFAAVQATMIGAGLRRGERLRVAQWTGLLVALAGLVVLLLPGATAPSPRGALAMLIAGVAWGVYSLRGRGATDAIATTADNFLRATPFALVLVPLAFAFAWLRWDAIGACYALASGALASGLGYVVWYRALPQLRAIEAASVQLSVPVIAASGGVLLLGETLTPRGVAAGVAILGGIALVIGSGAGSRAARGQGSTGSPRTGKDD